MAFVLGRGYFICMLAAAKGGLAEKESRREGARCMQLLVLISKLPSGLEPFFPSEGCLVTEASCWVVPPSVNRGAIHTLLLGKLIR